MTKKVPVVGAMGNVGRGVVTALENTGYSVLPIDPQINKKIEDLTDQEFATTFSAVPFCVYVADCGNRDEYEAYPKLGDENAKRFREFCERLGRVNPAIVVWYVGGSWTKRKPDENWIVDDDSPNKDLSECNRYEAAKILAENTAFWASSQIKVRFVDWPSIVPNLAPNFSISKMTRQAIEEGKISYSAGDYGRPLISSTDAGVALIKLIENDDSSKSYAKYLIPAVFVSFLNFAQAVQKAVVKNTGKTIILEKQESTPDFLKSKCQSKYLEKLGFSIDKGNTLSALDENADKVYELIFRGGD